MKRKGIISTVIISILIFLGLNLMIGIWSGSPIDALPENQESAEEYGEMGMIFVLIYGVMLLWLFCIPIVIAITHAICLIFTIRNRKSRYKIIRIINYVLDGLNIFLIVAAITRLALWIGGI